GCRGPAMGDVRGVGPGKAGGPVLAEGVAGGGFGVVAPGAGGIAKSPPDKVVPAPAADAVRPEAARQLVVAAQAPNRVVPLPAINHIDQVGTGDEVGAVAAGQLVLSPEAWIVVTDSGRGPLGAPDDIVPGPAAHRVGPDAARQGVAIGPAVDDVVPRLAGQDV